MTQKNSNKYKQKVYAATNKHIMQFLSISTHDFCNIIQYSAVQNFFNMNSKQQKNTGSELQNRKI